MNKTKTALIFGLITSGIMIISWFATKPFMSDDSGQMNFEIAEIAGYAAMILSMLAVFVGVKKYRDTEKNGVITFKEAFLTGLYIVLVASVIYVVGWMIYYPNFMPDFADQYVAQQIESLKQENPEPAVLEEKIASLKSQMEAYDNPVMVVLFTFLEFFPIGLVFALIWALVLKKQS